MIQKYKAYLTRRNVIIGSVAVVAFLCVAMLLSSVSSRRSHTSDLRASAEQLVAQADSILGNTSAIAPEDKALLDLLAPSTLSQTDLVTAMNLLAQQLNLPEVVAVEETQTLTKEQALAALNIDPTLITSNFEVVTTAVDVVADMPRLIRFIDLARNSRVSGPLVGISNIHFTFNGNETVATLHLVGLRFAAETTSTATTVPSETTIPGEMPILGATTVPTETTMAP